MMCSSFSMCTCVLLVNMFYYGHCGEPFCVSLELLYCRQHIDNHQSNKEHQPTDVQIYSARQSSCTSGWSRNHSRILRTLFSALFMVSFIKFLVNSNCQLEPSFKEISSIINKERTIPFLLIPIQFSLS